MHINLENEYRVTDVVWPCEKSLKQSTPKNKKHDLIQFGIMCFAATILLLFFRHLVLSIIIYFLSFLVLIGIFICPSILRFFNLLAKATSGIIAKLLSCLLLVPFYFLCFFPGHIILSIICKDPLNRKFEKNSTSYWILKQQKEEIDEYKVQY
jgi:hypothetical protein